MKLEDLIPLPPLHPYLQTYAELTEQAAGWGLDLKTLLLILAFLGLWLKCRISRRRLLRRHAAELQEVRETDGLTQVASRRRVDVLLEQLIENCQRHGHPFSLILFELDQLKQVNSLLGHRSGDQALTAVSQFVQGHLRKMDVLGRWTGSRFIILCPSIDTNQALQLAEKLRAQLSAGPLERVGNQTASFGVVEYQDKSLSAAALVAMAEDALCAARGEGGNNVRGWA
ncbi:MAG: GGDEF domain-containing protein [Gammaproteobacteria bacterium]|nr:GGDEF domain-containing protein [Gammaproteobacteria bacterium]